MLKLLLRSTLCLIMLLSVIGINALAAEGPSTAPQSPAYKILLFTKTEEYHHDSIPEAVAAIRQLGRQNGFAADVTEDASMFTDSGLAPYHAVVFLLTTGDVLNAQQEAAFERYIEAGNGYVGIHAASDTEYDWAWYGGLVGAYLKNHPDVQSANILIDDNTHPSTADLPQTWTRSDEWYNFRVNPRGSVHVLARIDEGTYSGGSMGVDHPVTWCNAYDGGRSWYTAGGHVKESYKDPQFLKHILGGIQYAAGVKFGDCSASVDRNYEKVILDSNLQEPVDLSVAPDGKIVYVERNGSIKIYNPTTETSLLAGNLKVSVTGDDGLMSAVLDPNYPSKPWLYLLYSPEGTESIYRVSRFNLTSDRVDMTSEKILLKVPIQRDDCCHGGGAMEFDSQGNLYIPIGDNTNPFESNGFAPLDERAGRAFKDSQRTAGNSNNLAGKILRIRPLDDGSYTVPDGNLFPKDGSMGKPEIYIMGVRNPFRVTVDSKNNWIFFSDVGPDANVDDPLRGPKGYDEWNLAKSPGNYGWPYCIANNQPYRDFDFGTKTSGELFSCEQPVNSSPNNTGVQALPPAQKAWIWYPYGKSTEFPQLDDGGGRTAMVGPIYTWKKELMSQIKFPSYYNQSLLIYDWSRNWIKTVKYDENGKIISILPFLPTFKWDHPISMKFGEDGALYMIEYGEGTKESNGKLVRVQYNAGVHNPVAVAKADKTNGATPLVVQFSSKGSFDPNGEELTYLWKYGSSSSTLPNPKFTFTKAGNYNATLTVTNRSGKTSNAIIPITVGNNAPVVTVTNPPEGGFFSWGEKVHYQVKVLDAEDGSTDNGKISCSLITVQSKLGHNEHSHQTGQHTGCSGEFDTILGDSELEDLFYIATFSFRDSGAKNVLPIRTTKEVILQPKRKQAEYYTSMSGVTVMELKDKSGGKNLGNIDDGDWIAFKPINLKNINSITFRVASGGLGGNISVRSDSLSNPELAKITVSKTESWQDYQEITVPIKDPGGTHELFFVFTLKNGAKGLFNLDWIQFNGPGISHS
ncbi:ThuA domain-containing protein [Cohnella sp. AR92]|uniref:ThuA domain-containing protein n=1 Tax=Cohnella sp. AR92 TaxID=648716 RepID=UPI000F8D19B2|nr:ThuA domain-containing protein [Cohnella sp. AR92]RUS45292.1 carbohydrate-binding protein [Cohnella sp. AR92]